MIKKIKTKGMHCRSCENIIEKAALSVKGVKSAKSDFADEQTTIEFDENITTLDKIIGAIKTKGYDAIIIEAKNKSQEEYYTLPKMNSKYFIIAGTLLFLLGLFWIVKYFFNFTLPEITPGIGYSLIFAVGLLTSFHCIGMCSGFVLSYTTKEAMDTNKIKKAKFISHLKYGAGKTITYTILGALFGLLGSFIVFTPTIKGIAALTAGLFLIIYGLNTLNIFSWLRKLQFRAKFLEKINANAIKRGNGPFVIGLLNGLMIACGALQAMLIYAVGTGSLIQGALSMLIFGLGTLPLMLGFGSIITLLGSKFTNKVLKFSAVIVILLGLVMVNRGLVLCGSGYDIDTIISKAGAFENKIGSAVGIETEKDYQEIRMDVLASGWSPNKFVLKKDVPVRWVINGKEITGCNNAVQVPKLGLSFDIKPGEQIIEFTPEEEGIIPWSCWMGMLKGIFIVKKEINLEDKQTINKELSNINPQRGSCSSGCGNTCGAAKEGTCGCSKL